MSPLTSEQIDRFIELSHDPKLVDMMGLARVYLTVFTHNRGAVHVYEKMGFRSTEVLEKSWKLSSGEYVDMLVMELKRDEALFL